MSNGQHRYILRRLALQAMLERGLLPEFPPEVLAELDRIAEAATRGDPSIHALRHLKWCSIDKEDSRDLDQQASPAGEPQMERM